MHHANEETGNAEVDGSHEKYKAHLVAKGFKQLLWHRLHEGFSLVIEYVTLSVVIALTMYFVGTLDQPDVVSDFRVERNERTSICTAPKGVEVGGDVDRFEMVKEIYRLSQASRTWNKTFHEFVCAIRAQVSNFDRCCYLEISSGKFALLLVYVDDVL